MARRKPRMPLASAPIYAVLLFLSCSFSSMHLCASSNRLGPGKPLTLSHTLVSDDGTFALGFFSPSNSTKTYYYVGIWYNNIPEHTVVWVANRAVPITDPSAMFTLNNSSNLVLSDGSGHIVWRSNNSTIVSSSSGTSISAEAILDNTGNFILRSLSNNTILWQSFDHPTDTLLLGMNLRISHKTQPLQNLVSWNSQEDPSPGAFSYGADPENLLQRFIWNGKKPYRRSPVWSSYFLLGSYVDSLHSTIYMAVHRGADDEVYMSFGMPVDSSSSLIRMKINYLGKVNILRWDTNMSVWVALYTEPAHKCNEYSYCGPYGYCDNNGTSPTCKCLDGFEPKDDKGWVDSRFSQGCLRKKALRCSSGDGFLNLPGMKVPDHFLHIQNRSFDECTSECRSNCSCVAYAYANMSTKGINGDDTRCLIWTGTLIDMEKSNQGGESLYIRINKLNGIDLCRVCLELLVQSFSEIASTTDNFSESSILGKGGFGTVYKGTLGDTEIAVKRLSKSSDQGVVEFKNEVSLIAKLQHRNLVKLLGCCIQRDEKLLIYEYLPNKSLDAFLFDAAKRSLLDWSTRFDIIKGIARGLLYLHQDSRLNIIHRDLKASNVLLDAEMRPKISDFGTARIFDTKEQQSNTNQVVGTL
ncbi:hypothetical protein EJB05_09484 [Eragrostis curvula]|uniref:non-specific serine/threonine protein kinase n=1 Tax=Eragrostis curvula TaxID=38414 RepID=A0A5J9W4J7_9POAL|nr:hypothetical protein EJB05_09484 [Eragrostis curvula]